MSTYAQYDDNTLVKAVLANEPGSFDEFHNRFRRMIANAVLPIRPLDVDDAVQIVFLTVHKNLAQFNGGSKFTTWLYRVARNAALAELDKELPTLSLNDMVENDYGRVQHVAALAVDNNALDSVENTEERERLYAAIRELDELQRAVVWLRLDDLTFEEIGRSFAMRKDQIHRVYQKAVTQLRARLCPERN